MVIASLDHLPFSFMGADASLSVEQEFPLSGIRGARGRAAQAEADHWHADAHRAELDVGLEALDAFYMLAERRGIAPVLDDQIALVGELANISRAHLASGHGTQSDVLRLDNERARLEAERRALTAETSGAEAMLNTALARSADAAVPELAWRDEITEPAATTALVRQAIERRPEIAAVRADQARAVAQIEVMRSMYKPMAFVRAGPAYTMDAGAGVMAMVGVSVPLWRDKLAAGVDEAKAMRSMSSSDLDAIARMITGRIAAARDVVAAERIRYLAIRDDILPRARLVVESATGSFAGGQGSMIEILDATRDLRDIRMQEVMARSRLGAAWAALRRETGDFGGSRPPH